MAISKYFSWENFSEEFLSAIVYHDATPKEYRPLHKTTDKVMLVASMNMIAEHPDYPFARTYRKEIERHVLDRNPDMAKTVLKRVMHVRSIDPRAAMTELHKAPVSQALLDSYCVALLDVGTGDVKLDYYSPYRIPISIDMRKTIYNDVPLYDFQQQAVKALDEQINVDGPATGLLVMPTGSGKTRTATYFLLRDMISQGYQVVWLTHRHMLVDQAADAFFNEYPLIKRNKPTAKKFSMICVSGQHSSIRKAEKTDDVIIVSVQSGFRSLEYIEPVLARKVIVVIDEAHHAVARSYQRIVDFIRRKRRNMKLLGLTATPIRSTDRSSKRLMDLFHENIIYSIPMSKLISKKVLADPHFERIETSVNFEPQINVDEAKLLKRFGELPATLIDRVAKSAKRNKVIVDTYMEKREQYGKTLIFALNIEHCYTLCKDLRKKGVKCDYIYSGRDDNDRIIKEFQSGELDVLVNINILTEGSDVPKIQTVFLTRPTQSECLLVQMIGRGLRGPKAQGTAMANIVDFCDKWETFNKWLNPEFILPDVTGEEKERIPKKVDLIRFPVEAIGAIYRGITYAGDSSMNSSMSLPCGWYVCQNDDGDQDVLVFEEQLDGYQAMAQMLQMQDVAEFQTDAVSLMNRFFGGFQMPPYYHDLELFYGHWKATNTIPEYHEFEERDAIDTSEITKNMLAENVGVADMQRYVRDTYEQHSSIIENIYGDFEIYFRRVMECLMNSGQSTNSSMFIKPMPVENIPFDRTPYYDLQELYQEVCQERFGGTYEGIESVDWTDRAYTSFYGKYYIGGRIRINSLLNSQDIPRDVIKYVIYHEMLHRDNLFHDKAFREKEHEYPDYVKWDRFLDNTMGKFDFTL